MSATYTEGVVRDPTGIAYSSWQASALQLSNRSYYEAKLKDMVGNVAYRDKPVRLFLSQRYIDILYRRVSALGSFIRVDLLINELKKRYAHQPEYDIVYRILPEHVLLHPDTFLIAERISPEDEVVLRKLGVSVVDMDVVADLLFDVQMRRAPSPSCYIPPGLANGTVRGEAVYYKISTGGGEPVYHPFSFAEEDYLLWQASADKIVNLAPTKGVYYTCNPLVLCDAYYIPFENVIQEVWDICKDSNGVRAEYGYMRYMCGLASIISRTFKRQVLQNPQNKVTTDVPDIDRALIVENVINYMATTPGGEFGASVNFPNLMADDRAEFGHYVRRLCHEYAPVKEDCVFIGYDYQHLVDAWRDGFIDPLFYDPSIIGPLTSDSTIPPRGNTEVYFTFDQVWHYIYEAAKLHGIPVYKDGELLTVNRGKVMSRDIVVDIWTDDSVHKNRGYMYHIVNPESKREYKASKVVHLPSIDGKRYALLYSDYAQKEKIYTSTELVSFISDTTGAKINELTNLLQLAELRVRRDIAPVNDKCVIATFSMSNSMNANVFSWKPRFIIGTFVDSTIRLFRLPPNYKIIDSQGVSPIIEERRGNHLFSDRMVHPSKFSELGYHVSDVRDLPYRRGLRYGFNGSGILPREWYIIVKGKDENPLLAPGHDVFQTLHSINDYTAKPIAIMLRRIYALNNDSAYISRAAWMSSRFGKFVPIISNEVTGLLENRLFSISGHLIDILLGTLIRVTDIKQYFAFIQSNLNLIARRPREVRLYNAVKHLIAQRDVGSLWHNEMEYKCALSYTADYASLLNIYELIEPCITEAQALLAKISWMGRRGAASIGTQRYRDI